MPKHMRWPKSCDECPFASGIDGRFIDCNVAGGRVAQREGYVDELINPHDLFAHDCPLVVRDEHGLLEYGANGWPEPTPFFGGADTSNMPESVHDEWVELYLMYERAWEEGID